MSEVKPCPFCGSADIQMLSETSHFGSRQVICMTCYASSGNFEEDPDPEVNEYDARAAWNRRVVDEQRERAAFEAARAQIEIPSRDGRHHYTDLRDRFKTFADYEQSRKEGGKDGKN